MATRAGCKATFFNANDHVSKLKIGGALENSIKVGALPVPLTQQMQNATSVHDDRLRSNAMMTPNSKPICSKGSHLDTAIGTYDLRRRRQYQENSWASLRRT